MFIKGALLLPAATAAGWAAAAYGHIPLPGPVAGLIVLLGVLGLHGAVPTGLARAGKPLLGLLPLFLVPVCVGLVPFEGVLERNWLALAGTILASLGLTLFVTIAVWNALQGRIAAERS